jgi:hypothetical protein
VQVPPEAVPGTYLIRPGLAPKVAQLPSWFSTWVLPLQVAASYGEYTRVVPPLQDAPVGGEQVQLEQSR